MKTMLIKKLKLALIVAVVTDIFALIFAYPTVYLGAFSLGLSTYNIVEIVLRHKP
jgi:hypothetical protein